MNRGAAFELLGNIKQAIGDFDRAIDLNPKYAEAYMNRGIANDRLGNSSKAVEDFKMASKLGNKMSQNYLRSRGINW